MAWLELHRAAVDAVNQRYNVLYSVNCRDFVLDYKILDRALKKLKRSQFNANDRIMLIHMDTDYYDQLLPCGLSVINILRVFKDNDIPLFLLLFVTNHYGIKKEFDFLLNKHHVMDRPTVVETLLSNRILSTKPLNMSTDLSLADIEKPGLAMMGTQRSHRVALCNFIKNNQLLPMVELSTNFKQ